MSNNISATDKSGRELLRAFQEDLEERPMRKTPDQKRATREANRKYEIWRKGGGR